MDSKIDVTTVYSLKSLEPQPTIHFFRGLPASGKSTLAEELLKSERIVRINKDSLRNMAQTEFTRDAEKAVKEGSKFLALQYLKNGYSVIIDDTNLPQKYEKYWLNIAKDHQYTLIKYEFTTPVDECIRRDADRKDSVGAHVIMGFYNKFYQGDHHAKREPVRTYAKQVETKLPAIIVDIDGTVALNTGRGYFGDVDYGSDIRNEPICQIVEFYAARYADCEVIFLSGREGTEKTLAATDKWIQDNMDIECYTLMMREEGDFRTDAIIKEELYLHNIEGQYNILYVLDDRDQTVEMWRNKLKLPTLQVYWGKF